MDHLPGKFNPAVKDVIVDAPAGDPGEFMAEIADADAKAPGQIISFDGLVVMPVNMSGDAGRSRRPPGSVFVTEYERSRGSIYLYNINIKARAAMQNWLISMQIRQMD